MGQRANYILIEAGKQTIHYNHWRANTIAADLYLGERRFIQFMKDCQLVDQLLDEVWIEGCVIVDIDNKNLSFWAFELAPTSVMEIYLKELFSKWNGWKIDLLYNRMIDAEKILDIDYISKQDTPQFTCHTLSEVIDDTIDEWPSATVIVITEGGTHVIRTGNINFESIVLLGEPIVPILLKKTACALPVEEEDDVFGCVIIDSVNKKLIIDSSEFGLWEQAYQLWDGYNFEMGDFGFVGALRRANINTELIKMSPEKARLSFMELIKQNEAFNPVEFAKTLLAEDKNIKFSPDFFDTVAPQRTIIEKIKSIVNRLMRRKM
ncbi:MAG: hypothetical protein ABIN13_10310 [Mucilaginibacter sp.]